MKFKRISGLFSAMALMAGSTFAQTPTFVQTDVIKVAGVKTDDQIYALQDHQLHTTRVFKDGLGRPIQSVVIKGSPLKKDIVQPVFYDALGRQTQSYLPYVASTSTGAYQTNSLTAQASFYSNGKADLIADDSKPWVTQQIEESPLQRLFKAGSVGDGYQANQTHYKSSTYGLSASTDYVVDWQPDATTSSFFADKELTFNEVVDEEGVKIRTFTNGQGQLVLKRQLKGTDRYDTYYIYDDAGQLVYTLQPQAIELMQAAGSYSLSVTGTSKLIFKMVYDLRARLIEKTVPGAGVSYIIYDPANRPVLMQDANMRAANKWMYMKYDVKGRVVSQGTYTDNTHTTRSSMQSYVDGLSSSYATAWFEGRSTNSGTGFYTNNIFPTSGITPLQYQYYDDYDINNDGTPDYAYSNQLSGNDATPDYEVTGMPTVVSKHTVGSGANAWLTSCVFYDKYKHSIQVLSNNHIYTTMADVATVKPDFTGKPVVTKVVKSTSSSSSTTVQTEYAYDHKDRVTAIDQKYNGGSTLHVATYAYNELGQMIDKKLGVNGSSYLQSVDYRFNIRGQLTNINNSSLSNDATNYTNDDSNDVFGMDLAYDVSIASSGNTPYYNGRLSAVLWKNTNGASSSALKAYTYYYDGLNRMTGAYYQQYNGSVWDGSNAYSEQVTAYDRNGNIINLQRNILDGSSVKNCDILTYTYDLNNPNRLLTVADAAPVSFGFKNLTGISTGTYNYDDNGNMTTDPYKGLTINYNIINRTDRIALTAGKYIDYTYDASGKMIRKEQHDGSNPVTTTDFLDGFVYIGGALKYFTMPEGRVRYDGVSFKNEYIITDHQGNSRVSFEDNGSGTAVVRQENSYYAFGLLMPNSNVTTPTDPNKQLYNAGSEWQNDYGDLPDLMQTFYRNYDAALGRFVAVDPMAEAADSWTTYQYAYNCPGMFNDPMGDLPAFLTDRYEPGSGAAWAVQARNEFNEFVNNIIHASGGSEILSDGAHLWGATAQEFLAKYQRYLGISTREHVSNEKEIEVQGTLLREVKVVHGNSDSMWGATYDIYRQVDKLMNPDRANPFTAEVHRKLARQHDYIGEAVLETAKFYAYGELLGLIKYTGIGAWVARQTSPLVESLVAKFAQSGLGVTSEVGGNRLLMQFFSTQTIDEAVNVVMKDPNKVAHLFPAKHNLASLVQKLGGFENTVRAVLDAANGKLPASGLFKDIVVNVGGVDVYIRGNVVNGIPRLGTMFIP